jgi:hypothetical protein
MWDCEGYGWYGSSPFEFATPVFEEIEENHDTSQYALLQSVVDMHHPLRVC